MLFGRLFVLPLTTELRSALIELASPRSSSTLAGSRSPEPRRRNALDETPWAALPLHALRKILPLEPRLEPPRSPLPPTRRAAGSLCPISWRLRRNDSSHQGRADEQNGQAKRRGRFRFRGPPAFRPPRNQIPANASTRRRTGSRSANPYDPGNLRAPGLTRVPPFEQRTFAVRLGRSFQPSPPQKVLARRVERLLEPEVGPLLGAVFEAHDQLAASSPVAVGLPDVLVLIQQRVVRESRPGPSMVGTRAR